MNPFIDACAWMGAAGMLMMASFRVGVPWLSAVAAAVFFLVWLPLGLDWGYRATFVVMHVYSAIVLAVCMLFPQADL